MLNTTIVRESPALTITAQHTGECVTMSVKVNTRRAYTHHLQCQDQILIIISHVAFKEEIVSKQYLHLFHA